MRKKVICVFALLILVVILTVGLVGCAPSRPDKFLQKLMVSESWGVITYNKDGEITNIEARRGNMSWSYGVNGQTYLVLGKQSVEMYRYSKETWSYALIVDESQVKDLRDSVLNGNASSANITNNLDFQYVTNNFEDRYEKKDGKWYERNTLPACLYVKGNSLYYQKITDKTNINIVYTIGYKFKLPKEAKQAKIDYENKNN